MAWRVDDPRQLPAAMLKKYPQLLDKGSVSSETGKTALAVKSKMGNVKTTVDGIRFDSRKEAQRYRELLLEQRAGLVAAIELQPRFELQPGFIDGMTKRWVRKIVYVADFRVTYTDGRVAVIDTKGHRTKDYLIKRKLFRQRYPEIVFVEE